jgi:Bacteriophage tail sheath protein
MPFSPTYPGVYIEEIPSGVRSISGVATSITTFIGRAKQGPVDDPIAINSFADFERHFGVLDAACPLSYAVRDFFLGGGRQAVIVRLCHRFFPASHVKIPQPDLPFSGGLRIALVPSVTPASDDP